MKKATLALLLMGLAPTAFSQETYLKLNCEVGYDSYSTDDKTTNIKIKGVEIGDSTVFQKRTKLGGMSHYYFTDGNRVAKWHSDAEVEIDAKLTGNTIDINYKVWNYVGKKEDGLKTVVDISWSEKVNLEELKDEDEYELRLSRKDGKYTARAGNFNNNADLDECELKVKKVKVEPITCKTHGKKAWEILNLPKEFVSFADMPAIKSEDPEKYFKNTVKKAGAKEFAKEYLELAQKKIGKSNKKEKIKFDHYYYVVVYDPSERTDPKKDNSDLTSRSYVKKAWVKKDNDGNILEVGSSEIKKGQKEQEVLYFEGPLKGQGFGENW